MEDNSEILKAITDLTKTVELYHGDFREFRGEQSQRTKALEEDLKNEKFWSTFKTVCVLPVIGVLHQIASHYGLIK